jgi:formyl-CoA transferase
MNTPLAGITVLDFGQIFQGPYATLLMAKAGANVIKIEPPHGEPARRRAAPGKSATLPVAMLNSNKRAITLNLKSERGRALLRQMVERADVLLENFSPGTMDDLGVGYAVLQAINPRLVYATGSGFGITGPDRDNLAMDFTIQAQSGIMSVTGFPDGPPVKAGPTLVDFMGGIHLYAAVVTALYQRERTGKGTHVATNLMANGIWANGVLAQAKLAGAKFSKRKPREQALNAVTNHYKCRDGRWIILSLLNEERQFPTLARCMDREDLVTDERFATKADRHSRSVELIKIFDEIFATKDLAEWRKILDGNGLVFGLVGILDDIPHDRQMIENEVLVPFENDTMLTVNSPIFIDGARKVQPRKPPGVGEHSDDILRSAGYDEAAIRKLRASGAVA